MAVANRRKNTKKEKKKRKIIIFIIIILLLLLLTYLLGYGVGKIVVNRDSENILAFNESAEIIKVTDENINITNGADLNIFANYKFNNEPIIAPSSNGSYKFYVSNITEGNVLYNISFKDEMSNKINMKYRLKIDNVYIRGNENTYVDLSELNVDDIVVMKNSMNMFTLEWYWEDDDVNDTYVGSLDSDEYYTLKIEIIAKMMD